MLRRSFFGVMVGGIVGLFGWKSAKASPSTLVTTPNSAFHWTGRGKLTVSSTGHLITAPKPEFLIKFHGANPPMTVASITPDGVFHFTADPTDENTMKFISLLEKMLPEGRQLTSVRVDWVGHSSFDAAKS